MIADLTGRTALITGGAQGVGKAIALVMAEQGADVAIGDVRKDLLAGVVREIEKFRRRGLGLEMDVSSRSSVEAAVSRVISEWGQLDILVNNAGVTGPPRREGREPTPDENWDFVLGVNLRGVVNCCDAVFPHMMERKYGKIINISSTAGKPNELPIKGPVSNRPPTPSPYSTSKAAEIRITQQLAPGAARHNINVNCICPTRMMTPMALEAAARMQEMNPSLTMKDVVETMREANKELNMFGRELLPEDVAKMVAFLASEDARNITGQSVNVDGGRCLV